MKPFESENFLCFRLRIFRSMASSRISVSTGLAFQCLRCSPSSGDINYINKVFIEENKDSIAIYFW